jgi:hypothetical protein
VSIAKSRRYAYGTEGPVARSTGEIESTLKRFGASGFGYVTDSSGRAQVQFEAKGRRVRFDLPDPRSLLVGYEKTQPKKVEAEERRLWRSLAMAVKSKLDIVESGISTFETEFLPYMVLESGQTFAQAAQDEEFVARLSSANQRPLLALPEAAS